MAIVTRVIKISEIREHLVEVTFDNELRDHLDVEVAASEAIENEWYREPSNNGLGTINVFSKPSYTRVDSLFVNPDDPSL